MKEAVGEVKQKKEFSQLPDSLVVRALELSKKDIKKTRALLRKYFGVFLTNKVLKLNDEKILKSHMSSRARNYEEFYKKIFEKNTSIKEILDMGCGVNGFSYGYLKGILGNVSYNGLEAVGQIVEKTNRFFEERKFINAKLFQIDLFDLENFEKFISNIKSPKAIFLFQILDALEAFEKNYSKKLLLLIKKYLKGEDIIIISLPTETISGKKKFEVKREWLRYFLKENFEVEEFFMGKEKVFMCWGVF